MQPFRDRRSSSLSRGQHRQNVLRRADAHCDVGVRGHAADVRAEHDPRLGAKRMLFWEADYIDDRLNADALKRAMSAVGRKAEAVRRSTLTSQ